MASMLNQIRRCLAQQKVWRYVCFASSVVGLLCYSISSSFNLLFGKWSMLKIFLYSIFSIFICLAILSEKTWQWSTNLKLKAHMAFFVLTITSVYSFFLDKAVNGKPDAYSLISNAAFAIMSLGLSKQTHCGFAIDLLYFFCGSLIVQLMKIKLLLVIVGVGFTYSLTNPVRASLGGLQVQDQDYVSILIEPDDSEESHGDSAVQRDSAAIMQVNGEALGRLDNLLPGLKKLEIWRWGDLPCLTHLDLFVGINSKLLAEMNWQEDGDLGRQVGNLLPSLKKLVIWQWEPLPCLTDLAFYIAITSKLFAKMNWQEDGALGRLLGNLLPSVKKLVIWRWEPLPCLTDLDLFGGINSKLLAEMNWQEDGDLGGLIDDLFPCFKMLKNRFHSSAEMISKLPAEMNWQQLNRVICDVHHITTQFLDVFKDLDFKIYSNDFALTGLLESSSEAMFKYNMAPVSGKSKQMMIEDKQQRTLMVDDSKRRQTLKVEYYSGSSWHEVTAFLKVEGDESAVSSVLAKYLQKMLPTKKQKRD